MEVCEHCRLKGCAVFSCGKGSQRCRHVYYWVSIRISVYFTFSIVFSAEGGMLLILLWYENSQIIKYSLFCQPCLNLGIWFSLKQDLQNGYTMVWGSLISQLVRPITSNILTATCVYFGKENMSIVDVIWKWQMGATQKNYRENRSSCCCYSCAVIFRIPSQLARLLSGFCIVR